MRASSGHLAVRPELCDRCGHCVRACPQGKLRVGAGFIYVDVSECTGCFECVAACPRGAITRRPAGHLIAQQSGGGKVVVGSRAEAKALRKLEQASEKMRSKGSALNEPGSAAPTAKPKPTRATARGQKVEPANSFWTLGDVAAVTGVMVASLIAKQAVLSSTAFSLMPASGKIAARALVLTFFYAVQLALLAFLARRRGRGFGQAFRLQRPTRTAAALAATGLVAGLLVATRVASTLWGAVAQSAGCTPPASEGLTGLFGSGGLGLLLAVVMVVLVAPFTEELGFREVIAGSLETRFGLWPAILGSAAIFSAYHLSAWVILPTFGLGVAAGWLARTRQTLWPAIVLHVLYNGVVVAAAFSLPAR